VVDAARAALSELSEDERMFQDSVRQFAAERIAPLVRSMDEAQQMDADLIRDMFALGIMGIEAPEEFGGSAGSFFDAILAVEAISAVDPAVGVRSCVGQRRSRRADICRNSRKTWLERMR
jgi:alkylation response protein AidB-like acyl-CoA dehydrogenase